MNYWLIKSEPDAFSIDDLVESPKQTTHWDGVRNYQARNFMRDAMQVGDRVFYYHSNCKPPGIVGICEVASAPYPDHTAFDPDYRVVTALRAVNPFFNLLANTASPESEILFYIRLTAILYNSDTLGPRLDKKVSASERRLGRGGMGPRN